MILRYSSQYGITTKLFCCQISTVSKFGNCWFHCQASYICNYLKKKSKEKIICQIVLFMVSFDDIMGLSCNAQDWGGALCDNPINGCKENVFD